MNNSPFSQLKQSRNPTKFFTNLKLPCQTQMFQSKTHYLSSESKFGLRWHTKPNKYTHYRLAQWTQV